MPREGLGCRTNQNHVETTPIARPMASAPAITTAERRREALLFNETAASDDGKSLIHRSALATSSAFCQRFSRSFAIHVLTIRSSNGGDVGCNCVIGCGSFSRIAAARLTLLVAS